MNQIQRLFQLQAVDSELDRIKHRLSAVLQAQKADAELEQVRAAAAAAEAELAVAQTAQRRHEAELAGINQEAKNAENRLYSGNIKNPKEMSDLQLKIAALGRHRGAIEDEILEAMLVVEAAQAVATTTSERLAELNAARATQLAELEAEQAVLTAEARELLTQREALLPPIEPAILREYNEVTRRRGSLAVVAVKNGICQGCQVKIPAGYLSAAQKGQLVHCMNCNRILAIPG